MDQPPLFWVRRIAEATLPITEIPLFGNAPPFPWDAFSTHLSEALKTPHLNVRPAQQQWAEKPTLSPNSLIIPIAIAPLSSLIYWAMGHQDIAQLTTWILHGQTFSSDSLQEGFYRFLLLEALYAAQSLEPIQQMTLSLAPEHNEPEGTLFVIDVEISLAGEAGPKSSPKSCQKSCWGKLLLTQDFRREWIHHFSAFPAEYRPTPLSQKMDITLGVRTGSATLLPQEWKKLKKGDFLLLDQQGEDILVLGTTPLFRVKIQSNQIQLIDYTHGSTMQDHPDKTEAAEEEAIAIKNIPLQVTVELARIQLTLDELINLSPGNTLDLPVHPDQAVTLTVNGQKVGKGELLHLGEALGVRILEVG